MYKKLIQTIETLKALEWFSEKYASSLPPSELLALQNYQQSLITAVSELVKPSKSELEKLTPLKKFGGKCLICDKEIPPTRHSNSKTCSPECSLINVGKLNRQYYKKWYKENSLKKRVQKTPPIIC